MDELDKDLFISKNTHVWNKEMFRNLSESSTNKISSNVKWVIDQIIRFLSPEESKTLNIKIEDKEYDLQSLLTSRWKRSLLELRIQTHYAFLDLNPINLQIFLERIDSCFLYPRKGRKIKILLNKDDTGSFLKLKKNMIFSINEIDRSFLNAKELLFLLIAILIILSILWGLSSSPK